MGASALVATALGSFAATNVDTLFAATTLYADAAPGRTRRVTDGQLLGFVAVLAIAGAGAAVLFDVPSRWIGLLGLVPLAMGIRGLATLRRRPVGGGGSGAAPGTGSTTGRPGGAGTAGFVTALLVTVGTSGDNLAVYVPLFREHSPSAGLAIVACFAVLEVLLLLAARWLGHHPRTLAVLERGGRVIVPVAYCCIGVVVLLEAGTFGWP